MGILFHTRGGVVVNCLNLIITLLIAIILSSCASSNVSRTTASNVDLGVDNAKSLVSGIYSGDAGETYQNASQATKGAIIGGAAGGVTGFASGIGFLPGLATGALLGASYGAYIDSNTNAGDRLENRGVNIVELGDHVLIVIPSARIFQSYSASIKPQAYSTLYLVAKYVNRYTKMLVKVSVYTNDSGSPSSDLALSTQQASSVAKFLLASGIDARLLYAVGCGGTRLVENVSAGWDASDNYRIEITLEKLYV